MENGIVQTIVMVAVLALALLFFAAGRSRDRIRGRLLRKSARRTHRPPTHRHP